MNIFKRTFAQCSLSFYNGAPTLIPAILFILFFGMTTAFLLFQLSRVMRTNSEKRRFILWVLFPFVLGGIFEVIGFIGRVFTRIYPSNFAPYIIELFFLLTAPTLYSISLCLSLEVLIHCIGPENYVSVSKYVTSFLIVGELSSFVLYVSGVLILTLYSKSSMCTARYVIISGLVVQEVFNGIFMLAALAYLYRLTKYPNETASITRNIPSQYNNWKYIAISVFISSALIFARSVFRLTKYSLSNLGTAQEVLFYCLDSTFILLNMLIFVFQNIASYYVEFNEYTKY